MARTRQTLTVNTQAPDSTSTTPATPEVAKGPVRAPKDPVASFPEKHRAMIEQAVKDGHVVRKLSDVTIRAKSSPTKKDEVQPFYSYAAMNARGMAALNNGKIEPQTPKPEDGKDERTEDQKAFGACDYHNYGYDLDLRQPIRVALEDEIAGPEDAINKAVKQLVDNGLFKTPEMARSFVIERRKAEGMSLPVGA